MTRSVLPNGIDALNAVLTIGQAMHLIASTARWVDPEIFKLLPVWYPESGRSALMYKKNWTEPLTNTERYSGKSIHKRQGNGNANETLTKALGLRAKDRSDWSCCHIWGNDDPKFQATNLVVRDHRFYTCVANMVLLPTPLKAFTDSMQQVKAMIRICARNLYRWQCDHETLLESNAELDCWDDWEHYPSSWPRNPGDCPPPGIMSMNVHSHDAAKRRWNAIRCQLEEAGPHYPRKKVLEALEYWSLDPTMPLDAART